MKPVLKEPLAAYYAAEEAGDFEALAAAFAQDGEVRDEGRTHSGRPAIARWMKEAKAKYRHRNEVQTVEEADGGERVTVRVSGDFPGSPVTLTQVFRVKDGQIVMLEIG
jgi:hypothetical protein